MKYKSFYISGSGEEYDGGLWEIKETPKMFIFEKIGGPFFAGICPDIMRIKKQGEGEHCLKNWEDGSFTVYPYQSVTPYVFTKIDD